MNYPVRISIACPRSPRLAGIGHSSTGMGGLRSAIPMRRPVFVGQVHSALH